MNKRVIIWVALAVLGLFAVTAIGLFVAEPDRRLGAINKQSYAAANSVVQINGVATSVKNVSGCDTTSDVIKAQPGTDGVVRKHLNQPRYEPCVLEVTGDMGPEVYGWIGSMLNRNPVLKDVTLIEADYNYVEKSRLQLQDAALTKVEFPALGGSSKDLATIKLTITPEVAQRSTSNAGTSAKGSLNTKQPKWLASNYRVTMSGGLPATRIASISSLVVTQDVSQDTVGETKLPQQQFGKLELGDLSVEVATQDTPQWDAWFHSFVVQGQNTQTDEKTATIELLDPSMKNTLYTLSLQGVGIFRAGTQSTSTEKAARKPYSLYVEEAAFSVPGGGTQPPATTTTTGTTTATTTTPTTTTIKEATIIAVDATKLRDGETFTISDGTNEPTTFEFDLDGRFAAVPVKISQEAPAGEVAGAIAEAINSIAEKLELNAKMVSETQVELVSLRADAEGEEKILEFVEDESFKVQDKVVERAPEALAAPADLVAATGGEGEVTLSWQPVEGALGYLILFATKPGGEYLELDKAEETKLRLAGLEPGVEHYFVVRALDGTQESADSNEAAAVAG